MNAGEQISLFDLDSKFGKTSREPCPQITETILEPCLKRPHESQTPTPQFLDLRTGSPGLILGVFWQTDGLSLGEYMTHSFGECPKDVKESHLSQILEDKPLPKYCLSEKACRGILNRARKRDRKLPKILEDALLRQCHFKNGQDETGGVKESSCKTNGPEPCPQAKTKQSSIVAIEGNGSRPSHRGDGYMETDVSYTLNSMERHAVAFTMEMTPKVDEKGIAFTLRSRDNKDPQAVAFSQDAYDKYTPTETSAALKSSGGNYGGGYGDDNQTVGALCARDYKGVGNQYVDEGKIIIQPE